MPPAALKPIRLTLLAAVTVFGLAVWLLLRAGVVSPSAPPPLLRYIVLGLAAAALVEVLLVRRSRAGQTEFAATVSLTLTGWALGETPALAGAVHWLVSGTPELYWVGCAAFLAARALLPIPDADRP